MLVKVTHNDRKTDRKCYVLKAKELKFGEWRRLHTHSWHIMRVSEELRHESQTDSSHRDNTRRAARVTTTTGKKDTTTASSAWKAARTKLHVPVFCCFFLNRSVYLYYKTISAVHRRDVIICMYYEEVADWLSKEKKAWQVWSSPATLESFTANSCNLSTQIYQQKKRIKQKKQTTRSLIVTRYV